MCMQIWSWVRARESGREWLACFCSLLGMCMCMCETRKAWNAAIKLTLIVRPPRLNFEICIYLYERKLNKNNSKELVLVVVVWVLYTHLKIINYNQLIKIKIIIIIINISKRYTIFHKHFSSFDFSYIFLKLIHFNLLFSCFFSMLFWNQFFLYCSPNQNFEDIEYNM